MFGFSCKVTNINTQDNVLFYSNTIEPQYGNLYFNYIKSNRETTPGYNLCNCIYIKDNVFINHFLINSCVIDTTLVNSQVHINAIFDQPDNSWEYKIMMTDSGIVYATNNENNGLQLTLQWSFEMGLHQKMKEYQFEPSRVVESRYYSEYIDYDTTIYISNNKYKCYIFKEYELVGSKYYKLKSINYFDKKYGILIRKKVYLDYNNISFPVNFDLLLNQ